jgi:hypothetical protein
VKVGEPAARPSLLHAACAGRRAFADGTDCTPDDRRRRPHTSASFVAAQRLEDAPIFGDAWFYRALSTLGQRKQRLLETDDATLLPPPPPLRDAQLFARLQLRLTATGERTLRGEADRVDLLGIDSWIGGTHITSDNTWRWDPTELKLVRGGAR